MIFNSGQNLETFNSQFFSLQLSSLTGDEYIGIPVDFLVRVDVLRSPNRFSWEEVIEDWRDLFEEEYYVYYLGHLFQKLVSKNCFKNLFQNFCFKNLFQKLALKTYYNTLKNVY